MYTVYPRNKKGKLAGVKTFNFLDQANDYADWCSRQYWCKGIEVAKSTGRHYGY